MAKQARPKPTRPSKKKPRVSSRHDGKEGCQPWRPPPWWRWTGRPRPNALAPAPRKPGYYEAVAIYETGVMALQKHDFEGAANQFRQVISRYPDERELHERSVLYLRVCERETAKRPPAPQTRYRKGSTPPPSR